MITEIGTVSISRIIKRKQTNKHMYLIERFEHEDEEARNAVLEILNLATELEALRVVDEDDDMVLYD